MKKIISQRLQLLVILLFLSTIVFSQQSKNPYKLFASFLAQTDSSLVSIHMLPFAEGLIIKSNSHDHFMANIVSFEMCSMNKNQLIKLKTTGPKLSVEMRKIVNELQVGEKIIFDNILAKTNKSEEIFSLNKLFIQISEPENQNRIDSVYIENIETGEAELKIIHPKK